MSNLTITTNEQVLKKARMRALQEGTSVNALLRAFLESYAGVREDEKQAISDLLTLSKQAQSRRGNASWTREDLHIRD